jgi:hypothetical protein
MMSGEDRYTTISIRPATLERLQKFKREKGLKSMDSVVKLLLDHFAEHET